MRLMQHPNIVLGFLLYKDAFVAFLEEGLKNFKEGTYYKKVLE